MIEKGDRLKFIEGLNLMIKPVKEVLEKKIGIDDSLNKLMKSQTNGESQLRVYTKMIEPNQKVIKEMEEYVGIIETKIKEAENMSDEDFNNL